jgi:hypothetical protein
MNRVQYTGEGEGRAWKIRQKCIDKKSAKPLTANRDYYFLFIRDYVNTRKLNLKI